MFIIIIIIIIIAVVVDVVVVVVGESDRKEMGKHLFHLVKAIEKWWISVWLDPLLPATGYNQLLWSKCLCTFLFSVEKCDFMF